MALTLAQDDLDAIAYTTLNWYNTCDDHCVNSVGGSDGTLFSLTGLWLNECSIFNASARCAGSVGGIDGTKFNIAGSWLSNCPMFKI